MIDDDLINSVISCLRRVPSGPGLEHRTPYHYVAMWAQRL